MSNHFLRATRFLGLARSFSNVFVLSLVLYGIVVACAAQAAETPVVLYAPYWRLGGGIETTIGINNTRPRSITITPHIYTVSGRELSSGPFTLEPMAAKNLSLRQLLVSPANEGTGYVELQFFGSPVDIAAQLLIEDKTQRLLWNHVFETKQRYLSSRYEGVFLGAGGFEGATLALTNVSSNTKVVELSLSEGSPQIRTTFELAARSQRVIALSEYLARSQATGRRAVGITISHSGAPGDVIAQGLASMAGGGSYNIRLVDSARLKSSRLISPALVLPWAHSPLLAVRNTGGEPSTISVIAHYKPAGAKQPQEVELQQLALQPNGPVVVDLRDSLSLLPVGAQDIGLEASVSNSQRQPLSGRTVADLLLFAADGRQVIQASPKDPDGEGFAGFSQPWDISGTNRTVIALANPSKTDRLGIMLSFHYEGGVYSYDSGKALDPGETKHISVNDLRDLQVPGALGQKMARTASQGQAIVSVQGARRVLVAQSIISDPSREVSLTSSCTTCPPSATGYAVSPTNVEGFGGDQFTLTPVCFLDDGSSFVIANPNAIDWFPVDSSIAWVPFGTFTLNLGNAGTTTVNSTSHDCVYQFNPDTGQCDCSVDPFPVQTPIQVKVRRPHAVAVVNTTAQGAAVCPAGQSGWSRTVTLELRDQFGVAIRVAGITMADSISIGTRNDLGITGTSTGSFTTNSQGQWPDTYFVCSSVCPTTGQTDANQNWTWNGAPLPHVNGVVYKCNSITIDGL